MKTTVRLIAALLVVLSAACSASPTAPSVQADGAAAQQEGLPWIAGGTAHDR
jgi:hypothetical protein